MTQRKTMEGRMLKEATLKSMHGKPCPDRSVVEPVSETIGDYGIGVIRLVGPRGGDLGCMPYRMRRNPGFDYQVSAELLSSAPLKQDRRWSDAMIRDLLGEPDDWKINFHYRSGPRIALYNLVRVEAVEQTEAFRAALAAADQRRAARNRPVKPLELTLDNVSAAMWVVNKAAKRRRDSAEAAYFSRRHGWAGRHAAEKRHLYELKDRTIKRALELGWARYLGIHCQQTAGEDDSQLLACYAMGTMRFHCPVDDAGDEPVEDLPFDWTSDPAPAGTRMPDRQAIATLEAFLADSQSLPSVAAAPHFQSPPLKLVAVG